MVYSPRNAKVHFCGFAGLAQARHTSLFIAYGHPEEGAGRRLLEPACRKYVVTKSPRQAIHPYLTRYERYYYSNNYRLGVLRQSRIDPADRRFVRLSLGCLWS